MKTLVLSVLLLLGCSSQEDKDRISELEKQTKELKEQTDHLNHTATLSEQAKCAKDARDWYIDNWRRDPGTTLLTYSNHLQASSNKCFIFVQHNYWLDPVTSKNLMRVASFYNIYDNIEVGAANYLEDKAIKDNKALVGCTLKGEEQKRDKTFQECVDMIFKMFMDD
jgi:outer membrane murein-binding lipoprotein Lpp